MANLFKTAKKTTKSTTKKQEKLTVHVNASKFDSKDEFYEFQTALKDFAEVKKMESIIKAKKAKADGVIKGFALKEFVDIYSDTKANPGSFIVRTNEEDGVLVMPMDKYLKINEEDVEDLQEMYGEDVIETTTVYKFNNAILEKYMDEISELIMSSEVLSDEDKENLIQVEETHTIKKGAINQVVKLAEHGEKDIEEVLQDIQPIIMLKKA